MSTKIPFLVGHVILQSSLSLEEVGQILSERVFGGLKFGGKDLEIHEEVPAIFIDSHIMGLQIALDGFSGMGSEESFDLSIRQVKAFEGKEYEVIKLDSYLKELLKESLAGVENILVID